MLLLMFFISLYYTRIENVPLCISESSNTPATSMMKVFVRIVTDYLIVICYHKGLLFRCGSGSDARKRFSDIREFSHP